MQLVLQLDDRAALLVAIHRRLRVRSGAPARAERPDPVSQLVLASIGGRTRSEVSLAAFHVLRRRFGTWDALRDAPLAEVAGTIRMVTYADAKAARLQTALRMISAARGKLCLDFLAEWPVDDALRWLERLPGVGRKVAAATLNFSTLQKKTLVVDTHHLRVMRRLGLVGPRAGLADAADRLMPYLPASWAPRDVDDHHELVKKLGQDICRHAAPECPACPLRDLCPTGTRVFGAGRGAAFDLRR